MVEVIKRLSKASEKLELEQYISVYLTLNSLRYLWKLVVNL